METIASVDLLRETLNIFQLEGRKRRHLSGLLGYTVYIGISYFVNINARLTQEIYGSSVVCNLLQMLKIVLKFHLSSEAFCHPSGSLLDWEMLGAGFLEHKMSQVTGSRMLRLHLATLKGETTGLAYFMSLSSFWRCEGVDPCPSSVPCCHPPPPSSCVVVGDGVPIQYRMGRGTTGRVSVLACSAWGQAPLWAAQAQGTSACPFPCPKSGKEDAVP